MNRLQPLNFHELLRAGYRTEISNLAAGDYEVVLGWQPSFHGHKMCVDVKLCVGSVFGSLWPVQSLHCCWDLASASLNLVTVMQGC